MNPKRKLVMQKIFNPSQYRSSNQLTTLTKENFERIMFESINKAINSSETPVKEKHVRKLVIGSYQAQSAYFLWESMHFGPVSHLKEHPMIGWKFCYVLHKMLRDGPRQVLLNANEKRAVLVDVGHYWRFIENGYGSLINDYIKLLYERIAFHIRNPQFPIDLKFSDEHLDDFNQNTAGAFYELSIEVLDQIDRILTLQDTILKTVDKKRLNSTSSVGQCHLAPLVACIQDSSLLYDYSVKILFKLHSGFIDISTLEDHRRRFLEQHKGLISFYISTSNLQYFKTLIQIPHLPERSPNFLVASELQQHVTPNVFMISSPEIETADQESSDHKDGSGQLLVNFSEEIAPQPLIPTPNTSMSLTDTSTSNDSSLVTVSQQTTASDLASEEISQLRERIDILELKNHQLKQKLTELTGNLKEERAAHLTNSESLKQELESCTKDYEVKLKQRTDELRKLKDDISNLNAQLKSSKTAIEKEEAERKRAEHENMISGVALKRIVKEISDLKSENASLRNRGPLISAEVNVKGEAEAEKQLEEMRQKVSSMTLKLEAQERQQKSLIEEKEELVSSKLRLEQQLKTQQEDLLIGEMNETDRIIKEATKKIEELSEKSRKLDSGIKLQVNEKIAEVCSNLMKAVRNLIIQSRLLQNEVVGDVGKVKSAEFYQRNSSWTEGLISAANVVAMAARSLVDSADRSMSGQAKFSELAAAANEVVAATTQLVVASRVKANKDSEKLKILTSAAKQVNQCKENVVETARVCAELIESEIDEIDISSLTLHQTKKLEMETQVKLLELEHQLAKERIKLGLLRRKHYEHEEAQEASGDFKQTTTASG